METNLELIKEELINWNLDVKDSKNFFEIVCKNLEEKGYIKSSFLQAIQVREQNYPTGLQLKDIAIAIPHTDVEHVKRPFICINKLSNPILFGQMGTDNEFLNVNYVLILGIKEPTKQVGLLSTLMTIFSDESFVNQFKSCKSNKDMYDLFNKFNK